MAATRRVAILDSHTGGEPTRLVLEGGPDLGNGTIAERREIFRAKHDRWRAAIVNEPRGSDALVGALLCKPADSTCEVGVIFFNNVGVIGIDLASQPRPRTLLTTGKSRAAPMPMIVPHIFR